MGSYSLHKKSASLTNYNQCMHLVAPPLISRKCRMRHKVNFLADFRVFPDLLS